ncbi:MAG: prolipoprotein diacylglyceryl transferase, partial [Anaerolineae bacterium]|nr:prolipoprotein diacylglyceryl transferase [Anaerolineae bacterium]
TGYTPDPVAFALDFFGLDLDVYWYGVIITAGIALGAYVVASLAQERAVRTWLAEVPVAVRRQPLSRLSLSEDVEATLTGHGMTTVGELLLWWGAEPERLGLKAAAREQLAERMLAHTSIRPDWVHRPPWYQWSTNHVWSGLFWSLLLAVIGARLYHVLTPSPSNMLTTEDYFANPLQLINVRRGGLGIYGGIAGGALGLALYALRNRISALRWADLAVIGLSLGQFVGRWGNFVNQELYGRPTDLPWAVTIEQPLPGSGYEAFSRFHPAFLYESLWNLGVFLGLWFLNRRYRDQLFPGELMAAYLVAYAAGRMLLETVRLDSNMVTVAGLDVALPTATLVSLAVALVMILWVVFRRVRSR